MPAINVKDYRVLSNAFGLWKDKEKKEGRSISIDTIARETGLAKMTVRKFVVGKEDVKGSPLAAAAALADYFGSNLDTLLAVEKIEGEGA